MAVVLRADNEVVVELGVPLLKRVRYIGLEVGVG